MRKEYTLKIPVSLDDVTIEQYQKYVKAMDENKENEDSNFINLKLLNIFCGITMKEAYELPIQEFDSILSHLVKILSTKPKLLTESNPLPYNSV